MRLALEHGCDLVPTLVFREKYMYNVWPPPRAVVSFFLRVLKMPVLLFSGRFFTWLPFHTYMSIVFDAPIPVTKKEQPTDEEVEEVWQRYRAALVALWGRYKTTYGYGPEETLEIREASEETADDGGEPPHLNGATTAAFKSKGSAGKRSKKEE